MNISLTQDRKPQVCVCVCVPAEHTFTGGNDTAWSFRDELLREHQQRCDQHTLSYLTSLPCDLPAMEGHLSIIVSNR